MSLSMSVLCKLYFLYSFSINERIEAQKETIVEKEKMFSILEAQNAELEASIPDVEGLQNTIQLMTEDKTRCEEHIKSLRKEELERSTRIADLKARIALQKEKNSKKSAETEQVLSRVKAQKMTKTEYRATVQET